MFPSDKIKGLSIKLFFHVITPIGFILFNMLLDMPFYLSMSIVVTIVLHEFGHYTAMKLFNYKSVSMYLFFPLGGVVTGFKERQKISESIVVVLAGPIPGIVLGLLILMVSKILPIGNIEMFGTIIVAINAFNLLPIFPLDGGVFAALLFKIKNRSLFFFLLSSFIIGLAMVFFLEEYFLLVLPVIQLILMLLRIWEDDEEIVIEYDFTKFGVCFYFFVYVLFTSLSTLFFIFN